jgi:HTH-type transcriptional regulator/antitoxin HigA
MASTIKTNGRMAEAPAKGDAMATKTKNTSKTGPKGKERNAEGRGKLVSKPRRKEAAASEGADPAYLALIRRFPLRPIRTEAELDAAAAIIDELTDRDDLSSTERDYLEVLGDLVEKYEDEHVAMPHVSDAEMLQSLMDEKGVRQADVVRGTGISKTVLSLVLNGRRDLTREHIEVLARYFGVNPAVFLGPA